MEKESSVSILDKKIRAICPIHGVSSQLVGDSFSYRIDYAAEATDEQRLSAQSFVDSWVEPNPLDVMKFLYKMRIDPSFKNWRKALSAQDKGEDLRDLSTAIEGEIFTNIQLMYDDLKATVNPETIATGTIDRWNQLTIDYGLNYYLQF